MPKPQDGKTTTRKGYIRITAGPHRNKYLHRRVIEEVLEQAPHPYYGTHIPDEMDVHHIDGKHDHNCIHNLLLLSRAIHNYITNQVKPRCPFTGKFMSAGEYARRIGPRTFCSVVKDDADSYYGEF